MNKFNTNMFFTEKDIYDALISSKRTLTIPLVLELARDRGIILSPDDSRENLIKYVSSIVHDFYDLDILIEHITPANKKEKSKVTKYNSEIDSGKLNSCAKEIIEENDDNINIQITNDSQNSDKTLIVIQYDEIDFSKTRLRQKIRKESKIELYKDDGSTKIRKASNSKVDEILSKLLEKVQVDDEKKLSESKIDLQGMDFRLKTEFFTNLIHNIDNYKFNDVTKVVVNHNGEEFITDFEDDDETQEIEEDFINLITNASFKGSGLLQTEEYKKLKDSGFYISSIVWLSDSKVKDGDRIEFEASIDKNHSTEELKYSIRGCYRYNSKKDSFTKTIRALKKDESDTILDLLEEASFTTYDNLSSDKNEE